MLCTDGPVASGLSDRQLCDKATSWSRRTTHSPFGTPAHGMSVQLAPFPAWV